MTADPLWTPSESDIARARITDFARWAGEKHGRSFDGYDDLWHWSISDLEGFWSSIAEYFDVRFGSPPDRILADASMPGAEWFTGATLNYAEHALRRRGSEAAILSRSQTTGADLSLSRDELAEAVGRCAAGLRRLGVGQGDRVVAYMPNIPETLVAFLAAASLGAVWSSCPPEFGTDAVLQRLGQIEPKVLFAVDGYRYGRREIDRREDVRRIVDSLPSLTAVVSVPYLDGVAVPDSVTWADLTETHEPVEFTPVPFDHPLYVLYSSGTTGQPKAIVHGHGGILLEHLKMLGLHHDLGEGDRFFWFTTTGWMMWNYLASGLLLGSTIALFDGDPGHPDLGTLWQLASDFQISHFGVSAAFITNCRKAGLKPGKTHDLSALRQVGSTGSPLPSEGFRWVYEEVKDDVLLGSASGGTDVCTAFVGPSPTVPVWEGEISCRCLGAKVEAYSPDGEPLIGEKGDLVVTAPMPSMPVSFWNDHDGETYRKAYFDHYPGVWRHGDWIQITDRGSCVITGRSDATLNRGGVRMGTGEFYRVAESLPEVRDSLVVHLEGGAGGDESLILFVAATPGADEDRLRQELVARIRSDLSPRHVPDEIHFVEDVPRTLSGKKVEIPVKRLLTGANLQEALSEGSLANPESLGRYLEIASGRGN